MSRRHRVKPKPDPCKAIRIGLAPRGKNEPIAELVIIPRDVFFEYDGKRIARRGIGGTWESLMAGYVVCESDTQFCVELHGERVH